MKRRISDLLDGIREDAVELNEATPLSSSRIKELTMKQIEQNKSEKPEKTRTIAGTISKILLVAALLCSLTVAASAVENFTIVSDRAHGQVLDKNGNILKDIPLKITDGAHGQVLDKNGNILKDVPLFPNVPPTSENPLN